MTHDGKAALVVRVRLYADERRALHVEQVRSGMSLADCVTEAVLAWTKAAREKRERDKDGC
jgi:hypothetical protein